MKTRILLFLLAFSPSLKSQDIFYNPVIISDNIAIQGIIREGKNGFMWIGTSEGLVRYDGRQFKFYQNDPLDSTSIFDNSIADVLPLNNEIWVGTSQGFSVLDLETEKFKNYRVTSDGVEDSVFRQRGQDVTSFLIDDNQDIYIGTSFFGIIRFDGQKFTNLKIKDREFKTVIPSRGDASNIMTMINSGRDSDIIWAGTLGGLLKINRESLEMQYYNYEVEDKGYQLEMNVFRRLYEHTDGLIYCGSWQGVHVFNPETTDYYPLPLTVSAQKSIQKSPIFSIMQKSDSEIWISSLEGVHLYLVPDKKFSFEKYNNDANNEFYGVQLVDEAGRIWFSTIKGIYVFDPLLQQLREHSFRSIVSFQNSVATSILTDKYAPSVWVCPNHTNAIYQYDLTSTKWARIEFGNISKWKVDRLFARGFAQIGRNLFAISSDQGVLFFNSENGMLYEPPGFPNSIAQWFGLAKDLDNNLWVSSSSIGVARYNLKDHSIKIFDYELFGDTPISERVGGTIFVSSRGDIYIRRVGGFSIVPRSTERILNFLYETNPENSFPMVESFAEDKHGHIIASSEEGWIGFIDSDQLEKGIMDKRNIRDFGAIGERIWRFTTDSAGDLWGISRKEILRIKSETHTPEPISCFYGAEDKVFFSIDFESPTKLIFGERTSIYSVDVDKLRSNTELPKPYIKGVSIKQTSRPDKLIDLNNGRLSLNHDENFFALDYSAICYTLGNQVKFRYRLDNFEDWQENIAGDRASYTNVPSGEYKFQLQASNNAGVWNPEILELLITVKQPWYFSGWFLVPVAIFIVLMIYSLYSYRVNQVRHEAQLKTFYEKELARVEMSSLIAQMNPHFLFNSLNSIESYIIKNNTKTASEYLNNFAKLMRLILQNSKSRLISLAEELDGLKLYLQMESLRFDDKFKYEINVDIADDPEDVKLPPMIIQPFLENAIWHGLMHKPDGEAKEVLLSIGRENDLLVIRIKDNGIGRKKAEEIKANRKKHKKSAGMSITKDRLELINKMQDAHAEVEIIDLTDEMQNPAGTLVEIRLNSLHDSNGDH